MQTQNADITTMLLEAGANIDAAGRHGGRTPLRVAVDRQNTKLVEMLLERGPTVNFADMNGVGRCSIPCEAPVEGASVHATNTDGETPLYQAAEHRNLQTVKMLLDAGVMLKPRVH